MDVKVTVSNHSAFYPSHLLAPLVAWVAGQMKGSATVQVHDREKPGQLSAGFARNDGSVVLHLSRQTSYPRRTTHVREVGSVRLDSWQEELVLVLAHELRHVEQFATWPPRKLMKRAMEDDAERFAVMVLERFRAEASATIDAVA